MDQNRRTFAIQVASLAAAVAAGIGTVEAHELPKEIRMSADGWNIKADTKFRCATCRFWGGMRKITDDKKQVVATSLGWCNNPNSPMYRSMTTPDHEMTKPGVWVKWEALA